MERPSIVVFSADESGEHLYKVIGPHADGGYIIREHGDPTAKNEWADMKDIRLATAGEILRWKNLNQKT